jgi:hypothetical protein
LRQFSSPRANGDEWSRDPRRRVRLDRRVYSAHQLGPEPLHIHVLGHTEEAGTSIYIYILYIWPFIESAQHSFIVHNFNKLPNCINMAVFRNCNLQNLANLIVLNWVVTSMLWQKYLLSQPVGSGKIHRIY